MSRAEELIAKAAQEMTQDQEYAFMDKVRERIKRIADLQAQIARYTASLKEEQKLLREMELNPINFMELIGTAT